MQGDVSYYKTLFRKLITPTDTLEEYDSLVAELRSIPYNVVFSKAYDLAVSKNEEEQLLGLKTIQQFGGTTRYKRVQTIALYFKLLEDTPSEAVLQVIFDGLAQAKEAITEAQILQLIAFKNTQPTRISDLMMETLLKR